MTIRYLPRGETTYPATCRCGTTFRRPAGAKYGVCLRCQTRIRLSVAGFKWTDEALLALAEYNAAAFARAGQATEQGRAA
jgi:hypothetical protein